MSFPVAPTRLFCWSLTELFHALSGGSGVGLRRGSASSICALLAGNTFSCPWEPTEVLRLGVTTSPSTIRVRSVLKAKSKESTRTKQRFGRINAQHGIVSALHMPLTPTGLMFNSWTERERLEFICVARSGRINSGAGVSTLWADF